MAPHKRLRHAHAYFLKLSKLWPSVGMIGARQTGKTTIFKNLELEAKYSYVSFDDDELREEAENSAKVFLKKRDTPLLIDEVQKVPAVFNALKLIIDADRIPGRYFLTGSTQFSEKIGIRESLTGRIGTIKLFPFTYMEAHNEVFSPLKSVLHKQTKLKVPAEDLAKASIDGGMPIPMFLRDREQQKAFWSGWLDTTIYRDLAHMYGRGYKPDIALRILREFGVALKNAEWPGLRSFSAPARTLHKYLEAMEIIFLVNRMPAHPKSVGGDVWRLLDSGLACYLMGTSDGDGPTLSLMRHYILNELEARLEYSGQKSAFSHYRAAKGASIDFIDEDSGTAFRIVTSIKRTKGGFGWDERPLRGAMKTLGLKQGYLVAPTSIIEHPKKGQIGLLPWSYWSG